ncbi:MAG TPA: rhomboid family intramembrane serine protease [Gaiellaceae bacterium]|nr:rhomboid family intramembrane serine protease [Gaiellaceae bacterium]
MIPIRDSVPGRSAPVVTVALIAANVAVFVLYQLPNLDRSVLDYGYLPCRVDDTCPGLGSSWALTVFTSMFLHAGWEHLLGNMLFLWIFGNNVEDAMGRVRYLVFYVLAGLAATATQTLVTLSSTDPSAERIPNVGASGAIAGVLGAYFVLLPRASVLVWSFFFLFEVPAILFLGFWFVFQLWSGGFSMLQPEQGGGVAFFAHVGGFAFGLLTVRIFQTRPPGRPGYA